MALHKSFPKSPHEIIPPEIRWFPATEEYEKLLPPLVQSLRREVYEWRKHNYEGASDTSKFLLEWWFKTKHISDEDADSFQYYFAQREAVETVIYLYDVIKVKDHNDLITRFDSFGLLEPKRFDETWRRFVIKMATGSGKTKVISLLLAWSYFHKTYEKNSELSRNFLIITPNIIVLDRLKTDFDGFKIFHNDPILPVNGYGGKNWQNDFQMTLHIQDELKATQPLGNVFLTNIHRVYSRDNSPPSFEDDDTTEYFLGDKPVTKTTDSNIDLGDIVRNIDELMVINDEAHHIHDKELSWFQAIQDIHNHLKQKNKFLSLQIDVTATPKHNNGSIFVQTISDYPLVEAIAQNIVKHPVLPDKNSRNKLIEKKSSKYTEKYGDYIHLGVQEWKKTYDENIKLEKKSILFVMTDDTRNCDEVATYLETTFPELKDAVLSIHTKKNGEISESQTGKKKEELDKLRKQANEIDKPENPHKAIVSVLVLKEGWDVKNVTTIVGLRPYNSKSKILPEQALGRGLRLMYGDMAAGDSGEKVSVIGTSAFMEFVQNVEKEGVEVEYDEMGDKTPPKAPIIIEVDRKNQLKDILELDIVIPVLTPRNYRDYKDLSLLNPREFKITKFPLEKMKSTGKREIKFNYLAVKEEQQEYSHTTVLDSSSIVNYQNTIGFFAQTIMNILHFPSGYDVIYEKVKEFVQDCLFEKPVELDNINIILNISKSSVTKLIVDTFIKEINLLTVKEFQQTSSKGSFIKLTDTRPFIATGKEVIISGKSVFNKSVGDNKLENEFIAFLEHCEDIISYTKNYLHIGFKLDYVHTDGDIKHYYPDFIVKKSKDEMFVIETKGREDLKDPLKLARLKQWCKDMNSQGRRAKWGFVFVGEKGFKKHRPVNFQGLIDTFREYQ